MLPRQPQGLHGEIRHSWRPGPQLPPRQRRGHSQRDSGERVHFGDMRQVPLSESVYRGRAGNDRGSPLQRTTHARCPAHLLWPVLEPHCLDEGFTGEEKTVPKVQKEAHLGRGTGLHRRLHQ